MSSRYIIGIDCGGTNLKIGLFNGSLSLIEKRVISTATFKTKAALINGFTHAITDILRQRNLHARSVLGVGIGLPGPVNAQKGIVYSLTNIRGWNAVPLKRVLQKRLGFPVFIDNDAKVMSLAEAERGAAKGYRYAVCLTLGTGVGGGIVQDGRLYRGSHNAAGEFGHLPVSIDGPRCNCGGRACLETYVGNNRIHKDIVAIFGKDLSLEKVSALARAGNRKALAVWNNVGTYLGVALVGIVNVFNPDCIVIGGGVANAGPVLFNRLKEIVSKRAMPVQAGQVRICKAKLGSDAGIVGAALIVKRGVTS